MLVDCLEGYLHAMTDDSQALEQLFAGPARFC